jgi:hypothetical protein
MVERRVFISYSHADAAWLERVRVHLRPLVQRTALDVWDDSRISPGQKWREEIESALGRSRIAVLLVSADFLASDFVVSNELPPLLHKAARGGLLVVPLIVSPCLFSENEELARYQCVNSPDRPLSGMSPTDAETTLVSLGRSIDRYFRSLDVTVGESTSEPLTEARAQGDPFAVDRPTNLSFDGPAPDGIPVGWFNSFGHVTGVSTEYAIRIARRSKDHAAGTCAVLERTGAGDGEFGSLMQRCPARRLAGKTVRIEGELRTENVTGWAGLWVRADADDLPTLFFDNMSGRPVLGTTGWTRYFIDALTPSSTDWLNYGILLAGTGTLYADNIRVLVWAPDGWQDA